MLITQQSAHSATKVGIELEGNNHGTRFHISHKYRGTARDKQRQKQKSHASKSSIKNRVQLVFVSFCCNVKCHIFRQIIDI